MPESNRPPPDPGQNWLLIGTDHRAATGDGKWTPGEGRSDTLMLLHVPKTGKGAYVISVPRDLYVEVPGQGKSKINSAYSLGGPKLAVQTIESYANVRIDHVASIDFNGFKDMTDALGGVDVTLKSAVHDPSNGWNWPAGKNHLNGKEALQFVRERKGLPGSDFDRVKRQQAFLKAVGDKAASTGTLANPFKLDSFLSAASKSIAIDDTANFSMLRSLGVKLARTGPDGVTFVSLPTGQSAWIGTQNVVLPDEVRTDGLFEALRAGTLADYVVKHDLANNVNRVN